MATQRKLSSLANAHFGDKPIATNQPGKSNS
jgi:hypothetical protein